MINYFYYHWLKYINTVFIAISLLLSSHLHSQETIYLDDRKEISKLRQGVDFLILDTSATITFNEIVTKDLIQQTEEIDLGDYNEHPNHTYWIKVKVKNNTNEPNYAFKFIDPHVGSIVFYDNNKEDLVIEKAGFEHSVKERSIRISSPTFKINDIPIGETYTYYFRVTSKGPYALWFAVDTIDNILNTATGFYFYKGSFFGICIFLMLLNFFFFLKTRSLVYIYYASFVIALLLMIDSIYLHQFIWSYLPYNLYYIYNPFQFYAVTLFYFLYILHFLDLKNTERKIWKATLLIFVLYTLIFLIDLYVKSYMSYKFMLLSFVWLLFCTAYSWLKTHRHITFLLIGCSFTCIGLGIKVLSDIGIIPNIIPGIYNGEIFVIGTIIELILFSIALSDRHQHYIKSKLFSDKLYIQELEKNRFLDNEYKIKLEQEVDQRTHELLNIQYDLENKNNTLNSQVQYLQSQLTQGDITPKKINSFEEFLLYFPNQNTCIDFLEKIKWKDGYNCKQCGNNKFYVGLNSSDKKCTKCAYNESITANTLFTRTKVPLNKCFYITYIFHKEKGNINTSLAKELKMNVKTCWTFLKKLESKKVEKQKPISTWTDYFL